MHRWPRTFAALLRTVGPAIRAIAPTLATIAILCAYRRLLLCSLAPLAVTLFGLHPPCVGLRANRGFLLRAISPIAVALL